MQLKQGTAIIIGAGPAGLTAALELIRHTDIKPILLEVGEQVGGLSRTVNYNGNRMDIGGHRFFSKSDRVMQWWLDLMPLESGANRDGHLCYQGLQREIPQSDSAPDPQTADRVMLLRSRKSRIYFLRRFFDYPIRVTTGTVLKLGPVRTLRCGLSYLWSALLPKREERTLEDFLINRFGRQLYLMFYKSYTEKVWGVPCREISAEWGAQRIKGLSLKSVFAHYLNQLVRGSRATKVAKQQIETSLIEKFLYPKFGPGQLWEHVADRIREGGGEIYLGVSVDRIRAEAGKIVAVEGINPIGERTRWAGDFLFSTMPVCDLIRAMGDELPKEVIRVSKGLRYRDFIIVGLLVQKLSLVEEDGSNLKDNWIYIQDPEVKVGRVQIFNNWSPWLVEQSGRTWIGLEYFCNESDELWKSRDEQIARLAIEEAARIGLLRSDDVEDAHVVRVPKSYPAYYGSYCQFDVIRSYTDSIANLFLIGRNGMHKYNNQDHSMLTAMTAVENIVNGVMTKDNIWMINTEMEYHEEAEQRAPITKPARALAGRKIAVAGTSVE